jgi:alkanesulfonate monooxygenase SsuD/methylene tetrahydromethanopterin reductase-like flavin-dependent oxidoreductase (luciferase family)
VGRLRLSEGVGWNEVEYTALNENFHNRGQRIEEQIGLLPKLWSDELVDLKGCWHTIPYVGYILYLSNAQFHCFGGTPEQVLFQAAQMGDGWVLSYTHCAESIPSIDQLRYRSGKTGKDPASFGVEGQLA